MSIFAEEFGTKMLNNFEFSTMQSGTKTVNAKNKKFQFLCK
jgi:hypothetical protein